MPEDAERKGGWSSLPVLLLWKIKDKLDIFDNMRFAAVCRDWWSGSACYPKRLQSVGDGLPWIWQESSKFEGSSREFISVAREDKFSIDLPEFHEASVVFSKCGWILLQRSNFNMSKPTSRRFPDSLFLINPFTREKVKLPDVLDTSFGYVGSFSICEGYPHCVVLLKFSSNTQLTIGTACPGDEVWTEHTYLCQRPMFHSCGNLITIGQHVYCYGACGRMIIYNMGSDSWKELPASENHVYLKGFVTEHDGAVVKIERDDFNFRSYKVFVYNDADTAWERLNNDSVRDRSWFLCDTKNCFSAKEKGLKVYVLCPCRERRKGLQCYDAVVVHDLLTGTTQKLHLPWPVRISATWVDVG